MILHLPDGRHISVDSHSGKVWLSSFNKVGTINPLTPEEAKEIGLALWQAGRRMKG
jgi:hypothetical protein